MFLNNIKMKPKLIGLFLIVGLIPLIVVAVFSMIRARDALQAQAYHNLEAVHAIKKYQIDTYFQERQGDMGVLVETVSTLRKETFSKLEALLTARKAEIERYFETATNNLAVLKDNPTTVQAIEEFEDAFEAERDRTGGTRWNAAEREYGRVFEDILNDLGYYDIFLIAADGDVVYSVAQESDLGENLLSGNLKNSGLAKAFQAARSGQDVVFADFDPYAPSGDAPAAFMAGPVKNITGTLVGVIAIQVPTDQINAIMQERAGMGQTGECYVVGPDNLMRSDSYLAPTSHSVNASFSNPEMGSVDTDATRSALAGTAGEEVIIDYNGNPVLSIYQPVEIFGVFWAIICEMDVAEAFVPVGADGEYYFAKYAQMYNYYDLFLINPDGHVFYTVAQEGDYQTNMLNGEYNGSNLGGLVQEVLNTKQFGFADFEPYAASNNEASAFIAQPLVHGSDVEVIVALQLPLEGINAIMQVREGMGETGEAYLVGPDKRMRSDSFLDAAGHSVAASFAGNVQANGADTEQVRMALAGTDGEAILPDYSGNPVLSAYGPVEVFDVTWAVLAEVNEEEINRPITTLSNAVLAIGGIASVIVAVVAFFVALSIANPVQRITDAAIVIAGGDVNQRVDIDQKDEIGLLADAFRQLIVYMQTMAGAADRLAQGDLTVDVTPQSNRDTLGNAFARMIADLRGLIGQVSENANAVGAAAGQLSASADQSAQAANQVATTIQQVANGTAQQTESVTNATTTVDQVSRAIEGVARGAQEQAAAVGRSAQITANISTAVQQVAVNAQSGAQSAAQTALAARNGSETVAKTIRGMGSIKASTDLVAQRVREMGQRSEQIGDIVETIDGIASQTNLLALNAAIEAARAGEHGKGFAVVADEVRKLAEGSANATKEIAGLIRTIQQTITEAVQAMEAGAAEVESGLEQAAEAGHALDSILAASEEVNLKVEEIAAAAQQMDASANELVGAMDAVSAVVEENTASTEEMAAGSGQISQTIENIAAISEENSASTEEVSATVEEVSAQVEEVTASAQSLSGMAEELQALVAQFKLPSTATSQRQPVLAMSHAPAAAASDGARPELVDGGNGQPLGDLAHTA
ncbi:MAG: methyl-accepting chemotaxis protein [Chloroflexi bacterium]|nr:methyl-accepting chemotaxis protein [Chloroflexota bacterium]